MKVQFTDSKRPVCQVCSREIEDINSGLYLSEWDYDSRIVISSAFVHKGECDLRLDPGKMMGSLELSVLWPAMEAMGTAHAKSVLKAAIEGMGKVH